MPKSTLQVVLLEDRCTPGSLIGKVITVAMNALPPADPTSPPATGGSSTGGGTVSPPPPVSPPAPGTY